MFILFAISSVVIIKDLKRDRWKKTFALIIFVLFLPIGATITDVIIPGSREYPYMAAGQITMTVAAFMVWQYMNKKNLANLLRYGEVGLMVFLVWTYFLSETYMQELRNHTWERFDHFASDVVTRVELNDDYEDDMPWMISHELGSMNIDWYKGGQVSTQGMSEPNFKGLSEYTKYFSKYLGFEYKPVDKETYDKIKETKEFKEMTVYPKKNSVRIIDGVVVIKTSEDVY